MSIHRVSLSLPGIEDSPVVNVDVEAADEEQAMDKAFEAAFAEYPQYGAFQIDAVEVKS